MLIPFGRISVFARVFILDIFLWFLRMSYLFFHNSHKNVKDKYVLINQFIFLAKSFTH